MLFCQHQQIIIRLKKFQLLKQFEKLFENINTSQFLICLWPVPKQQWHWRQQALIRERRIVIGALEQISSMNSLETVFCHKYHEECVITVNELKVHLLFVID